MTEHIVTYNLDELVLRLSEPGAVAKLVIFIGDNSSGKSFVLRQLSQILQDSILIPDYRTLAMKFPSFNIIHDDMKRFVTDFNQLLNEFNGTVSAPEDITEELGFRGLRIDGNAIRVVMWDGTELPIENSPAGIRSVVPVLLALNSRRFRTVLIEEPEIHLHPRAQRTIARHITNAVKAGKYVILTTYSDYLLYSFGNIIGFYRKNKERGIDPKAVSAYLFKRSGKNTAVSELEIDEYGIQEDEFAKVADEMLDERSMIYD